MTQPVPTQVRHPWRDVARTVFALAVALASLLPYVVTELNMPAEGKVGQVLVVAGAITRILALPAVNDFLTEHAPWLGLAAAPRQP